jgi:UDP-N-acetylglucosamine--N-acetylmuramyl-(pentapeptide) pyrophosphoryl-undecaprenol N-acetylglucosamine transferase
MRSDSVRVIISAGGTGGHIYPALAVINKIKEKEPNSDFLYIGTHNRMEKDIVPKHNIKYIPIKIIGFERKITTRNIKTIKYFVNAVKEAKKIIKEFNPDVVIGFGGYVTSPVIYAARKLGYPTMIHEQNSIPGLSNRFLFRYVDKIAISFEDTINYIPDERKVIFTGNPCSEEALKKNKLDKKTFGLSRDKKLVLIVMGSLGSTIINNKMKNMLQLFNNKEYEVLFITGKVYYDEFKELKLTDNIKIVPYVDNLSSLLKDVDLMVSRAGATTMSEIIALNIPTILIPSPHVVSNHQLRNALELEAKDAAILVEEKELNGDILVREIDNLFKDKEKYNKIKTNLNKLAIRDSATKIYTIAKELVDRRK